MVDLKLVSRPDRLSNGDQWQQFKFLFENMMGCVSSDFRSELEMAGTREAEIVDNPAWTDDQKRRSATLYATLASLTSGPPQHIVRSVVTRSGYEAWRKLCREYEARSGSQTWRYWCSAWKARTEGKFCGYLHGQPPALGGIGP